MFFFFLFNCCLLLSLVFTTSSFFRSSTTVEINVALPMQAVLTRGAELVSQRLFVGIASHSYWAVWMVGARSPVAFFFQILYSLLAWNFWIVNFYVFESAHFTRRVFKPAVFDLLVHVCLYVCALVLRCTCCFSTAQGRFPSLQFGLPFCQLLSIVC